MSRVKKVIIGVLVLALVAGAVASGLLYMRNANVKEVLVCSVDSLASDYYMSNTTLEGQIATNVSQNVVVDKDMIIEDVYVSEGDSVKKGDTLITFDMTLVEMELNIAKLKLQKEEQDLRIAEARLNSLRNGGPIVDSEDANPYDADGLGTYGNDIDDPGDPIDDDDMASLDRGLGGNYLAAAVPRLLLAAFTDDGAAGAAGQDAGAAQSGDELTAGAVSEEDAEGIDGGAAPGQSIMNGDEPNFDINFQDPSAVDITDGEPEMESPEDSFESGEDDTPKPSPTPTPEVGPDTQVFDPYYTEADPNITDGEEVFYQKLDYTSRPFTGKGTEEDPYVFLSSSARGKVTITGAFFNLMAGYSADGTTVEKEGGSWFQLEFHENDTIADYRDRKVSCTGYYLIDGSMLAQPVYMYAETEYTLEGASHYEEELPEEEIPDDGGMGEDPGSPLTREEAIKIQENRIASLKLDIQESNINITKLEKKVSRKVVYSKLDGTVAYVGDPLTGISTGNAFIRIRSKDGYYVRGSVSELMLDEVKEGTILNCTSYESGTFQAEVMDVSDYPVSSDSYFGEGNPNVSYYTYSATITDKSLHISDQEWITVNLQTSAAGDKGIVLSKAFVRTENGTSYVYVDDNGVLKKQVINVGATVDGGYSVLVTGGITREDKIAFPYGKLAQDGIKTKTGTLDQMYGY